MTPAPLPDGLPPVETPEASPAADRFFSAAIPRMLRFVLILGAALTVAVAWRFGMVMAIGFAAGSFIAYLSFRSLNRAVQALARAGGGIATGGGWLLAGQWLLPSLSFGRNRCVCYIHKFLSGLSGLSVWAVHAGCGYAIGSGI